MGVPSDFDIAVVGMGCRFPGAGKNQDALWDMLVSGESAWSPFPSDRLNIGGFYHPSAERADSFNFKGAHFIDGDITAFDREFFDVSEDEARALDPQQRLLLEVAYEALENAGIRPEQIKGTDASVWIGSFVKDYEQVSMTDAQTMLPDCATGNGNAILANRISFAFDLRGTSQTIDTGCSGGLVAIHQAVQDLFLGNSNMAIAGGVGLIMTPGTIMPMNSLGFLSRDGKCFTFDSRANGYGRGEGAGLVVLKTLKQAIQDNDTIRAVIRGTASTQDGRTPGITVPNPEAQVACIKKAYSRAGLCYDETQYVECHGTGTMAGDPRELRAISKIISHGRQTPLLVGSIKPNIGHLEGAAGIAGFIKAVMILEKGQIPKHINFENWNPDIKHDEWKVDVPRDTVIFPAAPGDVRRVSVNCFGFGGTNAHAIVDDAASYMARVHVDGHHSVQRAAAVALTTTTADSRPHVFIFAAKNKTVLSDVIKSHIPWARKYLLDRAAMEAYEHTLYSRRARHTWYYSYVASSPEELLQQMELELDKARIQRTNLSKALKIAYVFCGQGAQWLGMAQHLICFPVFRSSIEAASEWMGKLGATYDLVNLLVDGPLCKDIIDLPGNAQPATTALQVALVEQLQAWNIFPSSVVGHSSGEIAAAFAAGYITREQAWSLALHRGACAARVGQDMMLEGGMLAVALSKHQATKYIVSSGLSEVCVACVNSPNLVTLSGDRLQILDIKARLDKDSIYNKLLAGTTAYHSHHMQAVAEQYLSLTADIEACAGNLQHPVAMFSSLTGGFVTHKDLSPGYWTENLIRPVEFEGAVAALLEDSAPDVWVEIGPRPVWTRALADIAALHEPQLAGSISYLALSHPSEKAANVMKLLALLWSRGHQSVLTASSHVPKCLSNLPPYPWNHTKSYIFESHISKQLRFRKFGRLDFIGAPTNDSIMPLAPKWRGFFRVEETPWMLDHKIQGEVIYPAAGMVVMAVEAGKQMAFDAIEHYRDILDYEVSDFLIEAPMVVRTDSLGLEHVFSAFGWQTSVEHGVTTGRCSFIILSRRHQDMPYQKNASGVISVRYYAKGVERINGHHVPSVQNSDWQPKTAEELTSQSSFEFYEGLNVIGMQYGPQFRNVVGIGKRKMVTRDAQDSWECETAVKVPDTQAKMPLQFEFDHVIHPATLDAMFQTVFTLGDKKMLPVKIESIRIHGSVPREAGTVFSGLSSAQEDGITGDVLATVDMVHRDTDEGYHWAVEVKGLLAKAVAVNYDALSFLPSHRHLCSRLEWEEADIQPMDMSNVPGCKVMLLEPYFLLPLADHLSAILQSWGAVVTRTKTVPSAVDADCHVICLVELNLVNTLFDIEQQTFEQVKKLLMDTSKLLWVTHGAQVDSQTPSASPFLGWSRTVRSEDAAKHIICFDFSGQNPLNESSAMLLSTVFVKSFIAPTSPLSSSQVTEIETEYAEINGVAYVPRLQPMESLNAVIERDEASTLNSCSLDPFASYLLVGGLGGLGLDIAEFLATQGAKHLIFFSRSGVDVSNITETSKRAMDGLVRLQALGVTTYVFKVDVSDAASLKAGLKATCCLPKLKGAIQAAGVLRDSTYTNMTYEAWTAATRVKMVGSLNLHEQLPHDLDFFVLLSSAAGVIGNRGQANYAAGNAFQDALARHRRSLSPPLPAVSLDLGPVIGTGMVDQEMMDHLRSVGFFGIRKRDFHTILAHAIAGLDADGSPLPPQVVMGVGTGGLIQQNKPADPFWARSALFAKLNQLDVVDGGRGEYGDGDAGASGSGLAMLDLKPTLRAAGSVEAAVQALFMPLAAAMASIIPNLSVGDVRLDMTPTECNSDSMRGVNIDNWLRRTTGVSVGMGLNALTIRGICEEVVRKGGFVV